MFKIMDIKKNDSSSKEEEEDQFLHFNKRLRLRRCKSTSRAEDIVTENEKQRRAQPDKPYTPVVYPHDSVP